MAGFCVTAVMALLTCVKNFFKAVMYQDSLLKPDCLIYGDVLSQVMTLGVCHPLIWECLGESAVMVVKMVEIVNAHNYNAIYKDGCNTVQPPAYTVYYIMRIL